MRIKNKAELVERAEAHYKADRFIQGRYFSDQNPETGEFKGCEIGCLSMPIKAGSRMRILKGSQHGVDRAVRRIEESFGVNKELQDFAEEVFEDAPDAKHGGRFVVAFAKAVPEGVDVPAGRVHNWAEARGSCWCWSERRAFLDWLRRGCPAPRAKAAS